MDVSCLVINHIVSIDADDGDVASHNGEVLQVGRAVAFDAELDFRAFRAFEMLHHVVRIHSDERHGVGTYNTIASQDAYPFTWSSVNDGHDVDGVALHRELYANSAEGAFQVFACLFRILRAEIAAMRVEFAQYLRHSILDERIHIDRINIVVVDELQQVADFACTRVDDIDATCREMTGVERTDEDAQHSTNCDEQGHEAMLVV